MGFSTSFGDFVLDSARHQLLQHGREIHLSPKAYEFLKLLLVERPRALSKTEIHQRLWPGTFVTDATLASVAAEVRRALREGPDHGPFIRTVHAFGYAFASEATQVEEAAPGEPSLWWLEGEQGRFDLRPGENLLGREGDAIVRLHPAVISRHHARIVIGPDSATIEDLGSKNGTWVRGVRVTSTISVEDGDDIRLGSVALTFRSLREPRTTQTLRG